MSQENANGLSERMSGELSRQNVISKPSIERENVCVNRKPANERKRMKENVVWYEQSLHKQLP